MELAILFAEYISDNIYENTYQDINKDGRTWTCYNDVDYVINSSYETAKRYTVSEIYNEFLKLNK